MEKAAQAFFKTGRTITIKENYVGFSEPAYITVQSIATTRGQTLILFLNTADIWDCKGRQSDFHTQQRISVERKEAVLQAAIFSTVGYLFPFDMLISADSPSVFAFKFIDNTVAFYTVQFSIRGAWILEENGEQFGKWDFGIAVLEIQSLESYFSLATPSPIRNRPGPSPDRNCPGPSPDPNCPAPSPDPNCPAPSPNRNRPGPSPDPNCPAPSPDPNPANPSPDPNLIVQSSVSETECTVCMDPLDNRMVLIPCGHTTFCPECAPQLTKCPICRKNVTSRLRLYL